MKGTTWPAVLFVEEGAAFAELERRHLGRSRKDDAMNTETQQMTKDEPHFAPVAAWDAIAAGYDTYVTPGEADLATEALKLVGLRGGDRFLDVAAGTGGLSLPAARLGAKVVATDWSPKMIERFNARVRDERLRDVEGKVMDCHALAFADDTFEITGSLFGVMLVPDQPKALREMVRVTKPGGRVLLIAYGPASNFEALHCFIDALRAVNPAFEGLPSDPPPLEFQVSDPDVMRRRLTAAGLRDVMVDTTRQEKIELRSGQQLWDWCLGSNPIPGMLVADLTEAQGAAMRARIDETIRARSQGGAFALLTAPLNIGIGTK
ncbi:MAG TPA: methyltransferase domain-containing protein [Burkholderiales bacterium]|nr:methyltransferase domain-containing protein [Burkholderiales bacterium]